MALEDLEVQHFFIGGGAWHSAEQVRRFVYGVQQGAEGVCEIGDLRVLPYATPGGGVRVTIGSAFIRSNAAGAVREMYFGSVTRQQEITVPPNNTSEVRYDLVVMRVKDPYWQGSPWPDPGASLPTPEEEADARANAQYIDVEVISGVPAGTTKLTDVPGYESETAYVLARLRLPAMTGTITNENGMITDLRKVHTPRRDTAVFARPRVAGDNIGMQMYLRGKLEDGGEYFPGGGGAANQFEIEIPDYATRMVVEADWSSIFYAGGQNPYGRFWIEYGDESRPHTWPNKQQYEYATQQFSFNAPATPDERTASWLVRDEVPIPAKFRGKTITFVFKAGRQDSGSDTAVYMNALGGLSCRLTFAERAIGSDLL